MRRLREHLHGTRRHQLRRLGRRQPRRRPARRGAAADVTSYDYDAPIDERGRPTPKFWAFREVLAEYADAPARLRPGRCPASPPRPSRARRVDAAGRGHGRHSAERRESGAPPTFEELDVDRGLVRYRRDRSRAAQPPTPLSVRGLRDRAVVYVDGVRPGPHRGRTPLVTPVAGPAECGPVGGVPGARQLRAPPGRDQGHHRRVLHERQYLHGVRARGLRLDAFDDADGGRGAPVRPRRSRARRASTGARST